MSNVSRKGWEHPTLEAKIRAHNNATLRKMWRQSFKAAGYEVREPEPVTLPVVERAVAFTSTLTKEHTE